MLHKEGLVVAEGLGMTPVVKRMERSLRRGARRQVGYPYGLTGREVEILKLVARGFTNLEIGGQLGISPSTAARHVHNILTKTGMSNRAEVTALSMREGLIDN